MTCLKTKPGRYGGGTWANLYILIDAAAKLDTAFKARIYHAFITNEILRWRDDGGNNFKTLNNAIDKYLPGRADKSNKGVYINVARMLKDKINPDGGGWNTASYEQLRLRDECECNLIKFLEMGFIKDWNHLKETIHKL